MVLCASILLIPDIYKKKINELKILRLTNMKLFLTAIFCFFLGIVKAQINISIEAGYNRAQWTIVDEISSMRYSTEWINNFKIGVTSNIKLVNELYITPGVIINGKGTFFEFRYRVDVNSKKIRTYYAEIPVILNYQIILNEQIAVRLGGGGYIAYGLTGKEKGYVQTGIVGQPADKTDINQNVKFKNSNEPYKITSSEPMEIRPFDYGLSALMAIKYKKAQLLLSYSKGLIEVLPNGIEYLNANFKNKVVSVSLGYTLNRSN